MTHLNIKELTIENIEEKTRVKYLNFFKLLLVISLILVLLITLLTLGVTAFGPNWAIISIDIWVYLLAFLLAFFTILELTLYYRYRSVKNQMHLKKIPRQQYIDGKKIITYRYPKGAIGGVFSKTYITIDKKRILLLKNRIIPPGEIWK
jgi:hypothetical protein